MGNSLVAKNSFGQEDVSIYVKGYVDLSELDRGIKNVQIFAKKVKETIKNSSPSLAEGGFKTSSYIDLNALKQYQSTVQKVVQTTGQALPQVKKDVVISSKEINRGLELTNKVFKQMDKEVESSTSDMARVSKKNFKKITKESEFVERGFQGWALSLMFAGQIIKNTMSQIWASSTKTFQDVMHSTYGTVTAFDQLDGAITYLGFNIGQALEPIATFLAPIIEDIATFVGEHPIATKWIFSLTFAFGTLLAAITSLVLAGVGLEGLLIRLGIISGPLTIETGVLAGAYTAVTTTIGTATIAMWGWVTATAAAAAPWLILAGLIIAAVALGIYLGAVWKQVIEGWVLKIEYIALTWSDLWVQLKKGAFDATSWIINKVKDLIDAFNSIAPDWAKMDTSGIDKTISKLKEASNATCDTRATIAKQQEQLVVQMGINEAAGNVSLLDTINNLKSMLGLTTSNVSNPQFSTTAPGTVSQTVNNVTNNFVQQTGESNADFINRIMAEINSQATTRNS